VLNITSSLLNEVMDDLGRQIGEMEPDNSKRAELIN
jgi:hypothetical protein